VGAEKIRFIGSLLFSVSDFIKMSGMDRVAGAAFIL